MTRRRKEVRYCPDCGSVMVQMGPNSFQCKPCFHRKSSEAMRATYDPEFAKIWRQRQEQRRKLDQGNESASEAK